jgi:hypothetical protein
LGDFWEDLGSFGGGFEEDLGSFGGETENREGEAHDPELSDPENSQPDLRALKAAEKEKKRKEFEELVEKQGEELKREEEGRDDMTCKLLMVSYAW